MFYSKQKCSPKRTYLFELNKRHFYFVHPCFVRDCCALYLLNAKDGRRHTMERRRSYEFKLRELFICSVAQWQRRYSHFAYDKYPFTRVSRNCKFRALRFKKIYLFLQLLIYTQCNDVAFVQDCSLISALSHFRLHDFHLLQ